MRPLPPELYNLMFPFGSGDAEPDRPWWKSERDPLGKLTGWMIRTDGIRIYYPDTASPAEHDQKDPLPHPGFCAGQVWAVPEGKTWTTVLILATSVSGEEAYTQGVFLLADPVRPQLAPWAPV